MKNAINLGVVLLFLLPGCDTIKSIQQTDPEVKELEAFIIDYYAIMSAREWEKYRMFFTEKAVLSTLWQESPESKKEVFSNTISEFIAQTGTGPDSQPIFEEKPIKIDVEIQHQLASVWVNYKAKFGRENNLMQWSGIDLFSLVRYKGHWYITSLTYASDEAE